MELLALVLLGAAVLVVLVDDLGVVVVALALGVAAALALGAATFATSSNGATNTFSAPGVAWRLHFHAPSISDQLCPAGTEP